MTLLQVCLARLPPNPGLCACIVMSGQALDSKSPDINWGLPKATQHGPHERPRQLRFIFYTTATEPVTLARADPTHWEAALTPGTLAGRLAYDLCGTTTKTWSKNRAIGDKTPWEDCRSWQK